MNICLEEWQLFIIGMSFILLLLWCFLMHDAVNFLEEMLAECQKKHRR